VKRKEYEGIKGVRSAQAVGTMERTKVLCQMSGGKLSPFIREGKVAGILGVPRTTVEGWEAKQKKKTSNDESVNTCNPPDLRIKVPKKEKCSA